MKAQEIKKGNGEVLLAEVAAEMRELTKVLNAKILDEQQLREKWDGETIDLILENMRLHLGVYAAKLQWDILLFLLSGMPGKLREQQKEENLDEVTSELFDSLNELPHDEKIKTYKGFVEQIKNREALAATA